MTVPENCAVFEDEFNAETPRRRDTGELLGSVLSFATLRHGVFALNSYPDRNGSNSSYRSSYRKTLSKRMGCEVCRKHWAGRPCHGGDLTYAYFLFEFLMLGDGDLRSGVRRGRETRAEQSRTKHDGFCQVADSPDKVVMRGLSAEKVDYHMMPRCR